MTRVKDMGRRQQQAVFANLGKGNSTVSNMSARRESLMRNDLVTENHQDKIDKIMRDSRLTHRQKMDRIAKLKNGSSLRSSASDVGTGSSDAKVDSPAIKLIYQKTLEKAEERRLQRKAYKEKHPGAVFEPTKKPGVYLLKEKGKTYTWKDGQIIGFAKFHDKDKEFKWNPGKKKKEKSWKERYAEAKTADQVKKHKKQFFSGNVASAKRDIAAAHAKRKQEKTSSMQGRANLYKNAYATKGEAEEIKDYLKHKGHTDIIIFTDKEGDWNIAYNEKLKKKDLSYKELKASGVKLKPNADYDGDGVKNSKDCRPMNKNKQDLFDKAVGFGYSAGKAGAKAGTKFAQKKLYERSAKGRAEKAQERIRKIETKRKADIFNKEQKIRAERLEKEAKEQEAQYKKEHPSIFTRVSKSIKERRARKKSIYK